MRGAPNTIIFFIFRQYYWRTDAPCANRNGGPKKKKKLLAHWAWSVLPIGGGGHRCANILADRTQKMYRNVSILSRQDKKNKKRRAEQLGALRLFSSQSPINLAIQTGNGNTLQKRRRANKKINRHRSPRSVPYSISSLLPDPPPFSLPTTFNWHRRRFIAVSPIENEF